MKKIVLLFLLLISPRFVYALENKDFLVEFKTINSVVIIEELSEFEVDIVINSFSDFYGFISKFDYDKNKLELLEVNEDNGFECMIHKNIVIDKTKPKNGIINVCNLKFKAKKDFRNGDSTEIKMSNVEGAYDTFGNDALLKISIPKKYEAKLLSLTIDNYDVLSSLEFTTKKESINIDAIGLENNSITGLGVKHLEIGENIFKIIVKSIDNDVKEYILKVNRVIDIPIDNEDKNEKEEVKEESKNDAENNVDVDNKEKKKDESDYRNVLKVLIINNKKIELKENIYEYDLRVSNNINNVHIEYEKNNLNSDVILDGNLRLRNGNNVIKLISKLDNYDDVVYILNIYREYDNEENNLNDKVNKNESSNNESILDNETNMDDDYIKNENVNDTENVENVDNVVENYKFNFINIIYIIFFIVILFCVFLIIIKNKRKK